MLKAWMITVQGHRPVVVVGTEEQADERTAARAREAQASATKAEVVLSASQWSRVARLLYVKGASRNVVLKNVVAAAKDELAIQEAIDRVRAGAITTFQIGDAAYWVGLGEEGTDLPKEILLPDGRGMVDISWWTKGFPPRVSLYSWGQVDLATTRRAYEIRPHDGTSRA